MTRSQATLPGARGLAAARLLAGLALAAAGCGGNDVAMTVDVLSFVPAVDRSDTYLTPPGVRQPPSAIAPQVVTLGGISDRVAMERVQINLVVEFEGATGSGQGQAEVALYLAPPDSANLGAGLYLGAPCYLGATDVAGGTTRTMAAIVDGTADNSLLTLFQAGEFALGVAITFDATASPVALEGRWTIRQIEALILGRADPF